MRKLCPNKKTIDIYLNDANVIDGTRQTEIGKVSFADATHQMVLAYQYCKKHDIDFKKEV